MLIRIERERVLEKKLRGMLGFVVGSLRGRREEAVFVMIGSVRGSSEPQIGLAAWVEGREACLGLRENEENKKT